MAGGKDPSLLSKIILSGQTGGGIYMSLNGVETTIVDENGNVDAPVTSTNLTLSGTLDVGGVATFSDQVLVGTNASVGGNLTVGGTTIVNGVVADPVTFEDVVTVDAGGQIVSSVSTGMVEFVTVNTQQAITGSGAVTLTEYNTTLNTTGGGAYTLADSTMFGQKKRVQMIVDAGDATLTFNSTATIVFADVGDVAELTFDGVDWIPTALYNCADGATAPVYTPAA